MISFTYEDNSETVGKSLAAFQDALGESEPALKQIADDFREVIARQFSSEGRAGGTPWPPRAGAVPRGHPSPQGRHGGLPLLVRTGALRDSFLRQGAAGHVEEIFDQTLTLGSRVPYAIFHQTGTRRMPARPIIVLKEERANQWTEILARAIGGKTTLLGKEELT